VLKPGANKHVDLAGELKKKVATELGKALALHDVLFAAGLPKTRNAKMPHLLTRLAYVGENTAIPPRWKIRRD
jgi:acyl-coenzyme A synthetase/AMP-(fatty) acid ligase